jgi:Cu-Zn family superoxide dismutase
MGIRSRLLTGLLASTLSLSGGVAFAQDGSPVASPAAQGEPITVDLTNQEGDLVASATLSETAEGVQITVESVTEGSGLEPGEHGIHIHETGACDPSGETAFQSAGGHFNPMDASHGGPEDEDSHAGDLGNLTVDENGTFEFAITTDRVTLDPDAENSLADQDGSALVIHAGEDDLETDPSGESGERIACGVIFPATDATPEATPVN